MPDDRALLINIQRLLQRECFYYYLFIFILTEMSDICYFTREGVWDFSKSKSIAWIGIIPESKAYSGQFSGSDRVLMPG